MESLLWDPRYQDSECGQIEAAKFRLDPVAAKGQLAVIVAIVMAGAAVLAVFFGFLAYHSHPKSFWGRILRKKSEQGPRNISPPEVNEE